MYQPGSSSATTPPPIQNMESRTSQPETLIQQRAELIANERAWLGPWDLLVASCYHTTPISIVFDDVVSLQRAVDELCGDALCEKLSVPKTPPPDQPRASVTLVATT